MRFLSVADRELRGAARQQATYRGRWSTAAAFLLFLLWLLWVDGGFSRASVTSEVFSIFACLVFIYCLIVGTASTADGLSSEKREGTLGLLFLTNLSSTEIIAGKFCSRAMATLYSVVAIFPMFGLLVMMGGVTFQHFWLMVLALLNGLFFSVAIGFLASAICVRQFTSIATALGLAILFGTGPMLAATIIDEFNGPKWLVETLAASCPLYAIITADDSRPFGSNHYWISFFAVNALSLACLAFVVWVTARNWRDRPKAAKAPSRFKLLQLWRERRSEGRAALRRRLLQINPFFWLGSRQRVGSPVFMVLVAVVVIFTATISGPFFGGIIRAGVLSPLIGHLFAWFWAILALHALMLYYCALISSRRLAEDKQAGALELILSTPTNERTIFRGLWLAFGRRIFFPALALILIHFFFIWQGATLVVLSPPRPLPQAMSPGRLLWEVIFHPSRLDWEIRFMLQLVVLGLVLMFISWFTLALVGRWLGLRMKYPGFAPAVALALLGIPPVLLVTFMAFIIDVTGLDRIPERHLMPMFVWLTFAMSAAHCALLSLWAARRLRHRFRNTVTSHYQPAEPRRWLPRPRTVLRWGIGGLGAATAIVLLIVSFYAYQNWRSQRDWKAFQAELKQKGRTLDLASIKLTTVPNDENFAWSGPFMGSVNTKNPIVALLKKLQGYDIGANPYGVTAICLDWIQQDFAPLDTHANIIGTGTNNPGGTNLSDYGRVILHSLQPYEKELHALARAAQRPHFQIATNLTKGWVLNPNKLPIQALERLHLLFTIRACARLSVSRTNDAAEDFLTSLQLARYAGEIPDTETSPRMQVMVCRSLQPLWEGLARHQWSESQLNQFQTQLASFNFLAVYTNTVHRTVLAHIAAWLLLAKADKPPSSLPISAGAFVHRDGLEFQPRNWLLDRCSQLYHAGEGAIARIDFATGCVNPRVDWQNTRDLSLSSETMSLLQQNPWARGNPAIVSFAQTCVNQAVTACALERFYLEKQSWPESLNELTPTYLQAIPPDTVRGRPLLYHTNDTHYIIRGVGPNGQDNRTSTRPSDDWLWWYGTNAPAPAAIEGK